VPAPESGTNVKTKKTELRIESMLSEGFSIGVSHLIVCPRPAPAVFKDFDSPLHCCNYLSSSFSLQAPLLPFWGSAGPLGNANTPFRPNAKTPRLWHPVFPCIFDTFRLHPDTAGTNLRRSIALRMSRSNSFYTPKQHFFNLTTSS